MTTSNELMDVGRCLENFGGVFPRDQFNLRNGGRKFIINTDTSALMGEHWIAILLKGDKAFYFDPMCWSPPISSIVQHLIQYNYTVFVCQTRTQLFFSTTCGQQCIYFLHHERPADNDSIAVRFFYSVHKQ